MINLDSHQGLPYGFPKWWISHWENNKSPNIYTQVNHPYN